MQQQQQQQQQQLQQLQQLKRKQSNDTTGKANKGTTWMNFQQRNKLIKSKCNDKMNITTNNKATKKNETKENKQNNYSDTRVTDMHWERAHAHMGGTVSV